MSDQPPPDRSQQAPRVPLQREVSLKFKEFRGFITEFSANISTGGMYISTDSPKPMGSVFDFELALDDQTKLIQGIGEVVWVRERPEGDEPAGMGIRFLHVDEASQDLIQKMVDQHAQDGGTPFELDTQCAPDPTTEQPVPSSDPPASSPPASVGHSSPNLAKLPTLLSMAAFPAEGISPLEPQGTAGSPDPNLPPHSIQSPEPIESTPPAESSPVSAKTTPGVAEPGSEVISPSAEEAFGVPASTTPWQPEPPPETPPPPGVAEVAAIFASGSGIASPPSSSPTHLDVPEHVATEAEPAPPSAAPTPPAPTSAAPSLAAVPVELHPSMAMGTRSEIEEDHYPPQRRRRRRRPIPVPVVLGVGAGMVVLAAIAYVSGWVPGSPKALERAAARMTTSSGSAGLPTEAGPPTTPTTDPGVTAPVDALPVPTPAPAVPSGPMTRIERISHDEGGDVTEIILLADGRIEASRFRHFPIGGDSPRELIKFFGINNPYSPTVTPIGSSQVVQVRTGYHEGGELHIVIDLTGPGVTLESIEPSGAELRVRLTGR